jgi:hypothetical protein
VEADSQLRPVDIPINGRLIESVDGSQIGAGNFQTQTNMRPAPLQSSQNLPPAPPQGVSGMTKVVTNQIDSTYYKVRAGHHFRKSQPAESHVLVQAFNSDLTASQIMQNKTAIPSVGDFESTALYTTSTGIGQFSDEPDGAVFYCDGTNTLVWGGDEARCGAFLNIDPDESFKYDYSGKVTNTLTTAQNIATLRSVPAAIDSNMKALWHLNNAVTDSSGNSHTLTNANVTFSTTYKVFGTHGAVFNGTNAKLSIADHADFNFSGGIGTIALRGRVTSLAALRPIYYQNTAADNNSFKFYIDTDGAVKLSIKIIKATGDGEVVAIETPDDTIAVNTWYDIRLCMTVSGSTYYYYIFVDGYLKGYGTDTSAPANYTGTVYIGNDSSTAWFAGYMDEIAIFSSCLHTADFTIPLSAYGIDSICYAMVASTRPLQGVKLYNQRANVALYKLDFTGGGTTAIAAGDTITGATSAATAIVDSVVLTSGSWSGGDAAGCFFIYSQTGTFESENLDVGSSTNLATIAADSSALTQSVTGYYWSGGWTTVGTITDTTKSGDVPLAQTGSLSFTSTVSTAKAKVYNNLFAYWYLFTWTNIANQSTTRPQIYHMTLDAPMQPIVDIWDGINRTIGAYKVETSIMNDYSTSVYEDTWGSDDTSTYCDIHGVKSSQYEYAQFYERQTALIFHFAGSYVNTATSVIYIDYWDGDSWTSVGNIEDGTSKGSVSFGQSGIVSWNAPDENTEFSKSIGGGELLYTYRIHHNKTLSGSGESLRLYYVGGIPVQQTISNYKFPYTWNNRPILCNDQSFKKNKILIGAYGTNCVFNGSDSTELEFGNDEDIIACGKVFSRFGSSIYENLIVCKNGPVYIVEGVSPSEGYSIYQVSEHQGCVAPASLRVCDTGVEIAPGINKHVCIWLSTSGWVMFDNNSIVAITPDVANYFNEQKDEYINRTYIANTSGFYDPNYKEYHSCFVSGSSNTTINTEKVFYVSKKQWYTVDRGTDKDVVYAVTVQDTSGNLYVYGFTDDGYMQRLEYGSTFDGNDIVYTLRTGDGPIPQALIQDYIRNFMLIALQKTSGTTATIKYYGDGVSTATTVGTVTMANSSTKYAGITIGEILSTKNLGNCKLHSFEITYTNGTSETAGFQPLVLQTLVGATRESRR